MCSNKMSIKLEDIDCYSFHSTSELMLNTDKIKAEMDKDYENEKDMKSLEIKTELENVKEECSMISEHGPSYQTSVVKSEDTELTPDPNITEWSMANEPRPNYQTNIVKSEDTELTQDPYISVRYWRFQELEESTDQAVDVRTKVASSKTPVVTRLKHSQVNDTKNEGTLYWCDICGKAFGHKSTLQRHIKTHKNVCNKSFECNICSKGFPCLSNLSCHKNIDTEKKPFICGFSKNTFILNKYLKKSNLYNHVKSYVCNDCNKVFTSLSSLRRHENTHNPEEKPFACKFCGKTFKLNKYLQRHLNTHKISKPHVCSVCSRGFGNLSNLRNHENIHSRELFPCEFCSKGLSKKRI